MLDVVSHEIVQNCKSYMGQENLCYTSSSSSSSDDISNLKSSIASSFLWNTSNSSGMVSSANSATVGATCSFPLPFPPLVAAVVLGTVLDFVAARARFAGAFVVKVGLLEEAALALASLELLLVGTAAAARALERARVDRVGRGFGSTGIASPSSSVSGASSGAQKRAAWAGEGALT